MKRMAVILSLWLLCGDAFCGMKIPAPTGPNDAVRRVDLESASATAASGVWRKRGGTISFMGTNGAALTTALLGTQNGDVITLSPGVFDVGTNGVTLPSNVSLIGAGKPVTTIIGNQLRAFYPQTNIFLSRFTFLQTTGSVLTLLYTVSTITQESGLKISEVEFIASTNCTGPCAELTGKNISVERSIFRSTQGCAILMAGISNALLRDVEAYTVNAPECLWLKAYTNRGGIYGLSLDGFIGQKNIQVTTTNLTAVSGVVAKNVQLQDGGLCLGQTNSDLSAGTIKEVSFIGGRFLGTNQATLLIGYSQSFSNVFVSDVVSDGRYPSIVSSQSVSGLRLKNINFIGGLAGVGIDARVIESTNGIPMRAQGLVYSGQEVYSGTDSTSWRTLDLSSIVGLNRALVYMSVVKGPSGTAFMFRTYGETNEVQQASGGCGVGVSPDADHIAYVLCLTDSFGRLEWKTTTVGGWNLKIKLLTYQEVK